MENIWNVHIRNRKLGSKAMNAKVKCLNLFYRITKSKWRLLNCGQHEQRIVLRRLIWHQSALWIEGRKMF